MLSHFVQVLVAVGPVAVAAGNGVPKAGEDRRRVLGCFSVRNLHAAGIEESCVPSELCKTGLHGITGTGGLLKEHHKHGLIGQIRGWKPHGKFSLKIKGYIQHRIDFFARVVPKSDEMTSVKYCLHNKPSIFYHSAPATFSERPQSVR